MSRNGVLRVLIGQQVGKIGPKNRIAVPKKFRAELGKDLVVGTGFEECLILLSVEGFKRMVDEALGGSITEKKVREETRFLLSEAEEVTLDKQGRFVMPQHLKKYAQIQNEVYFIGLMRWVEVWDKKSWEERKRKQ